MIAERLGERSGVAELLGLCLDKRVRRIQHPVHRAGQLASPLTFRAAYCISFLELLRRCDFFGADRIMNSDKPSGGGQFEKIPYGTPCKCQSAIAKFKTDQVICFEVEDHACRVVSFEEEPPDTAKIICGVHDTCAKEFKEDGCCGPLPANVSLEGIDR